MQSDIAAIAERFHRLLDNYTKSGEVRRIINLTGQSHSKATALKFLNLTDSTQRRLVDEIYKAIPKQKLGKMPYSDSAMDLLSKF